jgi:hypothetical protein
MKTVFKLVAGLAVVAAVAWTASYLYWHVKIVGAVRTLQTQSVPLINDPSRDLLSGESFDTLTAAGCRSLPHLVGALNSANNPEMMLDAFFRLFSASLPLSSSDSDLKAILFLEENRLYAGEPVQKRREKIDRIRAWWKESGDRYYQWWRVWSSKCRAP